MSDTGRSPHQSLSDWIGDIVALESHVEEAMDRQLATESSDPTVVAAFRKLHDAVRDSKRRAVAYQSSYGSTAGNPVIKAGANLLGKAAGLIDKVRDDTASKSLRDDYTAYNLLAISYTMLYTTALALHDNETSAFAKQGLETYASLVQDVNQLIASAVLADLQDNENEPVIDDSVSGQVRATIDEVWKTTQSA